MYINTVLDLPVLFHLHSKLISWLLFDLPGLLWWWYRYRRFLIWLTIVLRRKIIPKHRITPVMAKNTGSSISAEVGLVVTWRKIRVDINKLTFVYSLLLCFKIFCLWIAAQINISYNVNTRETKVDKYFFFSYMYHCAK